ncbi:hypothetical protein [Lactococcus sp.]|uniref:hypothetical protein n=1 Tax=Lactococcus sp. TaxID=44273 RepID=UPI002FCACB67
MTLDNWIGIVSIIVSTIIVFLIYGLQSNISYEQTKNHQAEIQEIIKRNNKESRNQKIEFYNLRRFNSTYRSLNKNTPNFILGYTLNGGELQGAGIDDVHVICGVDEADLGFPRKIKIFCVGVIPYKNIKFIDENGDDTTYRMIFYVKSPLFRYPYKYFSYIFADDLQKVEHYPENKQQLKELKKIFKFRWFDN